MAENGKNSDSDILTCSIHILFSIALWWPYKPKATAKVAGKNSSQVAAGGNRMGLELFRKFHH